MAAENRAFIIEGARFDLHSIIKQVDACLFPTLAYYVAPQHRIVGLGCDGCGQQFQRLAPQYAYCGIECLIEFSPAGTRLLCMLCRPEGEQWAVQMFTPPPEVLAMETGMEQAGLWEEA